MIVFPLVTALFILRNYDEVSESIFCDVKYMKTLHYYLGKVKLEIYLKRYFFVNRTILANSISLHSSFYRLTYTHNER